MNRWLISFLLSPVFCLAGGLATAQSAPQSAAQQESVPEVPTFKVEVHRLLVPVVVRDPQGRAVGDLKKQDFQVFDNGKPRSASGLTVEQNAAPKAYSEPPAGAAKLAPPPSDATPPASNAATPLKPAKTAQRFILFVFDDLHLSVADLAQAKTASTRVLTESLSGRDIAAIASLSGKVSSGLTRDRARLQDAIASLQPRGLYQATNADCPSLDYYQADLIENKHNQEALQDATRKVFHCNPGLDTQRDRETAERLAESAALRAAAIGRQDVQVTYAALAGLVRSLSVLPGQRTLILVSSGFLAIDNEALTAESQLIDLAAQANVTISAMDARGLYTTELSASERSPALSGGSLQLNSDLRRSSQTQAESSMIAMAEGTGGSYFHNSNDLRTGFTYLAQMPEFVYLLELPLSDGKPDGTFHHLTVKVNRADVHLEARQGYFAAKPQKH